MEVIIGPGDGDEFLNKCFTLIKNNPMRFTITILVYLHNFLLVINLFFNLFL